MERSSWSTVYGSRHHRRGGEGELGGGGEGARCMVASVAGGGVQRRAPVRQGSGVLKHGQLEVFAVGQASEATAGAVAAVPTAAR